MRNALKGRLCTRDIQQTTSVVCYPLVALVFLLFAGLCSAQIQFVRTVGGSSNDNGNSVIQTTDGGYAVAGYTRSFGAGSDDLFLVKFDYAGSMQWAKAVGGTDYDVGYSVVQTTDGGYAVAGGTRSFGAGEGDLFFVKFTSTGSIKWAKVVGGRRSDYGYSVVQTTDGGFIVLGYTRSFGSWNENLFLVKFSFTGFVQWTKVVGGSFDQRGYSIIKTNDGGYIVVGYTEGYTAGKNDLFIVKFSSTGSVEWAKSVGGTSYDQGRSVVQTTDSGYLVTGYTSSFGTGNLFLVKFSSSGSLEWAKAVGGSKGESGYSIIRTNDGGCIRYVVTGYASSFTAERCDLFLAKFNSLGSLEWAKTVGGSDYDYGYSIDRTTDRGFVVTGYTKSFGVEREDLFLVKFDIDGNTCIGAEAFPIVTDVTPIVKSMSLTITIPSVSIWSRTISITDVVPTVTEICTELISETLSKPISFELTVSPNPFNSSCAITTVTDATVEIFDLHGRLVWNKPSDSDYIGATTLIKGGKPEAVPLNKGDVAKRQGVSASAQRVIIWQPDETISSGVYLVRATTNDGQQITKRVVYLK